MHALIFILGFAGILSSHTWGAIYQNVQSLPAKTFDFVIIGGGTAGCVIANRLTENPKFNILVIEAGPTNEGVLNSMVPGFAFNLGNSAFDWNFTTTPQIGLNGRSLHYSRGHILGGSSSINGMAYTRGSSDDFDRFAKVSGDPGWSWNNLQPYIRKNEKWTAPADNHNTTGQFDPKFHSFTGVNFVSLPGFPPSIDDKIIQTTKDLKEEFPFNIDMNSGHPLGVGWSQSTIGHGTRSSAATSYLGPAFINRPNLHVVVDTRVIRVLQAFTSKIPVFRTVEIIKSTSGATVNITASKEVILCGGSIGTPHILLNSGIGNETELKAVGITPVLHNPSVGKNLTDHPASFLSWSAVSNNTNNINTNSTLLAEALDQWKRNRTGPLVNFGAAQLAWTRLPNNSSIFKSFADPSAGPNTPHIELELSATNSASSANQNIFATRLQGSDNPFAGAGIVALTPLSRGSVTLKTNNPLDAPLINPAFLESEFDIFTMLEAVRVTQRFFSGPAWNNFIVAPTAPPPNITTDTLLEEFIRNTAGSNAHPVGTAAMSAKDASYGVVNPDLQLKGANGLRIVDASVMPFITSAHTQAPVYIIAERAADLIKATWA